MDSLNAKLTEQEVLEIVKNSLQDPVFFCRTFFPSWFTLPMPWFHRGLLAILSRQTDFLLNFGTEFWPAGVGVWDERQLDKILRHFVWRPEPEDPEGPVIPLFEAERDENGRTVAVHMQVSNKTLVVAPRGISKTTIINAENIRSVVNRLEEFIVYLGETGPHAEMQLDTVKREIETNERLIAVYGNKKPSRSDPEHWSSNLIETTDGVVLAARGRGGQVRGLNHHAVRPTKIVADDIEDKESVNTEAQRDKAAGWLKNDVEQALPQIQGAARQGQLILIGTIIHFDSLIVKKMRDPEWTTIVFGGIDPDGEMLWEHYMTKEQYMRKKLSFIRAGKLSDFNMEFQSSTKSEGTTAKFKAEFIRYEVQDPKDYIIGLVCDPAIAEKKESDFCAYAAVGINSKNGRIHIFDVEMERGMSPRQQVDRYFELHFKWSPLRHGVETIAYQKALVHLLREEMFRKAKTWGPRAYFEIEPIGHHTQNKILRVEGILSPRYNAGYVTHQRRFPLYEEQLLDWPNSKKDGPDVVAMAVALLDPFAALGLGDDSDAESAMERDEYEALDMREFRSAP